MAKVLTTADKCLTLLVAVLVITNIILACSIGLILPRHIIKDGWIYIDNMEGATNESLRISCTCIRTIVTTKNESAEESSEEVSKRRLECSMDGKGFKCLNHLSRNPSHNSSIETLPNEEIKFETQNSSGITKSITVTSLMGERKVQLSSTQEVLRKDITSPKSPKDSINNLTISSITTRYQTEKPSISSRWYLSTLSGRVDTSSNNVVVSKEPVETLETVKNFHERKSQETTHHMIDQTKSMKNITLDEVTGEYTQQAEQMAVQVEPMTRAVPRNDITSSKLVKDPLVNNSRISSFITSYQSQKPSYSTGLYPATPSEEVDISSNNLVVPKEPVKTLETGEYSYSRVPQETTHQTTNQTINMEAIITVKPIREYTEQIRVMEKPSPGIDNRSSTEPFSKQGENLSSTFKPGNLNDSGTELNN